MRIISRFHDYYDTAMAAGIDKECVYIRDTKVIDLPIPSRTNSNDNIGTLSNIYTSDHTDSIDKYMIIGFCGEIYPCVIREIRNRMGNPVTSIHYTDWDLKDRHKPFKKRYFSYGMFNTVSYFKLNWNEFRSYFTEYKTPVFVIRRDDRRNLKLIINDKLNQYEFFRMKDPYTAFQDIHSYISGILGVDQRAVIEISNKDMAIKKGFGHKYAFRKEPEGGL